MANTTLTHKMIAREAAAILEEEASFLMNVNKGRQDEFDKEINGYNKGDYVDIKVPPVGRVFDGSQFAGGGSATDSTELSVRLQLNTQKHVALQFGAKEKKLELTDFRNRILAPQMRTLASVVEADLLVQAKNATFNEVGTLGTTPTTMKTYAQARGKLQNYLAPSGDRTMLFSSNANIELVDASKAIFNDSRSISQQYLEGYVRRAEGADFYEHQSCPVHTMGTQVAAMTVQTTATEGATTLAINGGTGTNTITKGTVFTVANVFRIHPLTGTATNVLQQFVVQADVTLAAGAGTVSVLPAMRAAKPNQTMSALPTAAAAVTFGGVASTSYTKGLMFHRDAFTVATAPLPVLASCEGYTARLPSGISVRVMTFGDGNNDYERTRIDILYGFVAVRPEHSCRVTE